ncbi:MAG: NrdJb, partial [Pseudomonadales bacterium]|nr:NrdJb [Pseudomonadales bacterium]
MAIKIDKKIVDYKVLSEADKQQQAEAAEQAIAKKAESNIIHMHESVGRPEMLVGSTYKIKTPDSEHAMYVTINDIVLNEGTEHQQRRPFEIF